MGGTAGGSARSRAAIAQSGTRAQRSLLQDILDAAGEGDITAREGNRLINELAAGGNTRSIRNDLGLLREGGTITETAARSPTVRVRRRR